MHLTVASHVIFNSVKLVFKRNFNDQQVHLLDESQITGSKTSYKFHSKNGLYTMKTRSVTLIGEF